MHELGFFDRPDTRAQISSLAVEQDWVIYVGLGGTIDKTGVSWPTLVEHVLARFEADQRVRELIVEKNGPVRAATIAEVEFHAKSASKDEATERIRNAIAEALYGPRRYMNGRLLEALAQLAFILALRGRSISFVTPNYDLYLYDQLYRTRAALSIDASVPTPPLRNNIVLTRQSPTIPQDWSSTGQVSCVYLHGYVSDGTSNELNEMGGPSRGEPVLGELGYHEASGRTATALAEMFRDRNVMIVGSSITDGPLVSALLDTVSESTETRRIAVQPLQSSEWSDLSDEDLQTMRRWNSRRLSSLKVEAIYPDYFGQVGQFISEIHQAVTERDADKMQLPRYWRRYSERLETWWSSWSKTNLNVERQAHAHSMLAEALPRIRTLIQAPPEEALKIELWARWRPQYGHRKLALWASSVGTWPDLASIRSDTIDLRSRYRAVQVFCAGAPRILVPHAEDSGDRWQSYLGLPLWIDNGSGQLPVGVILLASMRQPTPHSALTEPSSISDDNLHNLPKCISALESLGSELLMIPKLEKAWLSELQ